jgi:hypothetical protein
MLHVSRELIERYALRELSEVEFERANQHVAMCPECSDRLQAEIDLAAAMHSSIATRVRKIGRAAKKTTTSGYLIPCVARNG